MNNISIKLKNGDILRGDANYTNERTIALISGMLSCKTAGETIDIISNGEIRQVSPEDISEVNIIY